jgi:BirA family transcriptional regulator, biotin operon repressor / biotin---[acetyl-CoA-carboxylase] ligase
VSTHKSIYADLDRPPLAARSLRRALVLPGGLWRQIEIVACTASTSDDVAEAARGGEPAGLIVVAEEQTAGRGRRGRSWIAPARSGLMVSVLLRPKAPVARWGWLPLLVGVAVADAVSARTGISIRLKWPNDLVVRDRKLGGILVERIDSRAGAAAVIGFGINVSTRIEELPIGTATSLAVENAGTDRDALLLAILRSVASLFTHWDGTGGDPVASGIAGAYRARSATIGRRVRVEFPGKTMLIGEASDIDPLGRLIVDDVPIAAAEVIHLR